MGRMSEMDAEMQQEQENESGAFDYEQYLEELDFKEQQEKEQEQ